MQQTLASMETGFAKAENISSKPRLAAPIVISSPGECAAVQPASLGMPFPRATLKSHTSLGLRDDAGNWVPVQTTPLARWHDGSVKWLLVDFLAESLAQGETTWELRHEADQSQGRPGQLVVNESEREIRVETGAATFVLNRENFQPIHQVIVAGERLLDSARTRIALTDQKGGVGQPRVERVVVEDRGPVRATLRFEGTFTGRVPCRFVARQCFFAGTGLVRLRLTIHNPRRARHPGGLWDLGDRGSMFLRGLVLEVGLNPGAAERMIWKTEPNLSTCSLAMGPLEIYQDSSGGENWQSPNHVNGEGRVPCSFRGYRVQTEAQQTSGLRASPLLAVEGSRGSIAFGLPEFWQQFPKAMAVDAGLVRLGLWPEQFGDLFELQGGEQKTHTVWLNFGPPGGLAESALAWIHQPARARTTPQWYEDSKALDPFSADPASSGTLLDAYLTEVMTGPGSLLKRREVIDEYGWRNYGEIYADHELAYYQGPVPFISHYNNQYDVIYGTLLHYLRSGDSDWLALGDPLARHVIDIDIYHTNQDKAAYNGGLFWFTDHYKSAGTSTHRTYSKLNCKRGDSSYGGGPGSSHNFTTGLLHHYYLTGDPQAKETVVGLADWVVNMDDGRQNILGVFDDGATGSASCTFELDYQGPGRGAGNSINALLDAWQVTGQPAYLDKAESLIRRCIHPKDDVAARDFLNVELRWSYPVFLAALAKYLRLKADNEEIDFMYAYGRASLLHYSSWMVDNEKPYFDQVEKLEYPTEVWAAQELRKANVMRLAAAHAEDPLQARLVQRGEELANRGWQDLYRFDSRTVARAASIIFVEGLRDITLRSEKLPKLPRPVLDFDFGSPETFTPQKFRVRAQLKTIGGLARVLLRLANPWHWFKASRFHPPAKNT